MLEMCLVNMSPAVMTHIVLPSYVYHHQEADSSNGAVEHFGCTTAQNGAIAPVESTGCGRWLKPANQPTIIHVLFLIDIVHVPSMDRMDQSVLF